MEAQAAKAISAKRSKFIAQKAELETKIKASQESDISLLKLERFVELLRQKLAKLDFETKRMALDMLNIKVWLAPAKDMGNKSQLSLSALVQGFIFSLQVDGRERSTIDYYQLREAQYLF